MYVVFILYVGKRTVLPGMKRNWSEALQITFSLNAIKIITREKKLTEEIILKLHNKNLIILLQKQKQIRKSSISEIIKNIIY